MEIILAKSAGFCFGVERAVNQVFEEISKKDNKNIYTYGQIIHNKYVTNQFEEQNVKSITDACEINSNISNKVIIRAHGVKKEVYEQLDIENTTIIDCTCPFVKKIHKIVEEQCINNKIIIVGSPNHPEIIGINGFCKDEAIVVKDYDEALNLNFDLNLSYSVVVQTTYSQSKLNEILNHFNDINLQFELFNTICSATSIRQNEANEISKFVDFMIVLGDKNSSNSTKLYEICKKNCKNTYFIENICEIDLNIFNKSGKIGITAGASTPLALIKEAIAVMNENINENLSFEEMLNASMDKEPVRQGQTIKGTVISVNSNEVYVSFGYKADGIITKDELSNNSDVNPEDVCKVGDEIECYVLKINDGEGNVALSTKRLEALKAYKAFESVCENKEIVRGKITEIVKGGAKATINNVQVFVPASQISEGFVRDLSSFKDKEFDFHIIEVDASKRRVIASRKELAANESKAIKDEVFAKLAEGEKVTGTVSRIVDFGAFVDLGGVDGLIHISELAWSRVKKVSDILSVGQEVEVTVLSADRDKEKISLTLKDVNNDPWTLAQTNFAVDTVVTGKVARITDFGAFVELADGVDGLLHISQISRSHVENVSDALVIGQEVEAIVIDFNAQDKKISLSMKELEPAQDYSDEDYE